MVWWLCFAASIGTTAIVLLTFVKMNSIIFLIKSYILPDRSRYDPDIYLAMGAYKRDLFWHLKEIRHSKGPIHEPPVVGLDIGGLDETTMTNQATPEQHSFVDFDELRILEVCVNPLLTSNHKHFPYYSQSTIVCEDRSLRRVSEKRNYMSIGNLNSLSKFSDKSFDAVVVTLMLCSCRDIDFHVQEIYRVLVEGGHLYFLEHEPHTEEDGVHEELSLVSTTPFLRPLNFLFTWLNPPPESRSIVAAIRRNRFLKSEVLQNLYFPDTYPDRQFVLGFAIK